MTLSSTRTAATGRGMEDRLCLVGDDGVTSVVVVEVDEEDDGALERWKQRSAMTGCCCC